jgi:aryl-alcohol dehydrogenase-like predicted oxidoreductase
MDRRAFLRGTTAIGGAGLTIGGAATASGESTMPVAVLGRSGLKVSRLCIGGYHMNVQGEETALRILARAFDMGVTFYDSANAYHNGKSDEILGKAFGAPSKRQQVVLMTKCEKYTRQEAMSILETQLRKMKTDYLDLWQCHQVSEHKEVDQILAPSGALEAFVRAKEQGKVRHIGFTGHRDPSVHLRLLAATGAWETVQMPVNCVDPHYLSFIGKVLPEARKQGLGVIAMKSNAMGSITKNRVARIEECLRFTLSQDVDVLVSGVETTGQLEENAAVVRGFQKMSKQEMTLLLHKTKQAQYGPKIEGYKLKEGAGALHRDGQPAAI